MGNRVTFSLKQVYVISVANVPVDVGNRTSGVCMAYPAWPNGLDATLVTEDMEPRKSKEGGCRVGQDCPD